MKKKTVFLSVIAILIFASALFIYSFFVIYKDVKVVCLKAQNEYQEDFVSSLIKYIQEDKNSFRTRNSAIWALGQLADKEALPFLYELDNSLPAQEKCSYNEYLCKYEVEKAIRWCEQGNITNWMYQKRSSWYSKLPVE